eukprot:3906755-Pleurochrysis_carterae.AAC.1
MMRAMRRAAIVKAASVRLGVDPLAAVRGDSSGSMRSLGVAAMASEAVKAAAPSSDVEEKDSCSAQKARTEAHSGVCA